MTFELWLMRMKSSSIGLVFGLFAMRILAADQGNVAGPAIAIAAVTTPVMKMTDAYVTEVGPTNFQLGDSIWVKVSDLTNLLSVARLKAPKRIALFVEGNELTDVQPTGAFLETNTLRFQLKRTSATKGIWAPLLRNPTENPTRDILISAGVQGDPAMLVHEAARNTKLTVLEWNGWTIPWVALFVVLIVGFLLLAIYSEVLKSPEPDANGRYPYSLSRTQAAFWLFITAMSFVFIWVVTGDLSTLNSSVLALIGISAGTYLAATLTETPAVAVPGVANPANPQVNVPIDAGAVAKAVVRIRNTRFVGQFLTDILSDDNGVSVPKFQIFVWTIVLGIMFAVSVINELTMPEFSGTLLALMGISSATYVGAKLKQ
jgi:hypothetical protein